MGATIRKGFVCLCVMMLVLTLGLFGCGDIYRNMKISVDTTEIVLYLNGGEGEPSSHEVKAVISGIKNKKVSKEVKVVFDDEKIASAGPVTYSGNEAYVTIYAASPGTTNMRVKSLDNTKRVSSEAIPVKVVEKIESINTSKVVASVVTGDTIDLSLIPGITFYPAVTSETDLEFYFSNGSGAGTDSNIFGQIVDRHMLVVSPTAPEGFCDIVVKSTKLHDFDATSPLQKEFSVLIYDEIKSDDIVLSKYSKQEAKYVEVDGSLVMMSNYAEAAGLPVGVSPSIDEMVMVSLNKVVGDRLKNYVTYDIVENESTQRGVVKIDKNVTDVANEFKITPNQTGKTSLSLLFKIIRDGKEYVVKERQIDIFVETIVTKMEITTAEQRVVYQLGEESPELVSVGVFERTTYKGGSGTVLGTEIKAVTSPVEVINSKYKVMLGDGKLSPSGDVILRKDFENFINISDGTKLVKYGEEGVEFESGSKFYISYNSSMLTDEMAKNLSEFRLFVVSNYDEGLKRIEAEIVCSVFKALENLSFEENRTEYLSENNKELEIIFRADNNINSSLIKFEYNEEVLTLNSVTYDKNEATISLTTKKIGSSIFKVIEKYTSNKIEAQVLVVVPTDRVYLSVNKNQNNEIGDVIDNTSDGIVKTEIVKVQSGGVFNIDIKTQTEDATLEPVVRFDIEDASALIRRETVFADVDGRMIVVGTNYNNFSSNINDISTFASMFVHIDYYSVSDSGEVVKRTMTQEIRVGTYKKLIEFSFGGKRDSKTVEIYDCNYLSTQNKEKENIGFVNIIPYYETPYGSSYAYYLEKLFFIDGAINPDVWHVEYIGYAENPNEILLSNFQGIRVYANGSDALAEENRQIRIQFTVKEFRNSYNIVCTIKVSMPTPVIDDIEVGEDELYVEDWSSSAYNKTEIKTSTTPYNVFDKNLSYVVYSARTDATQIIKVYDSVGFNLINRYSSSGAVDVEMIDSKVYAKCVSTPYEDETYYVAVLPSYLINFENTGNALEYTQRVKKLIDDNVVAIDQVGVCKALPVRIANGTEANAYKIANMQDMKTMLRNSNVNRNGVYFTILNTIAFDEEVYQREDDEQFILKANIMSDSEGAINGITSPLFDAISVGAVVSGLSLYYEGHESSIETDAFGVLAIENSGTIDDVSLNSTYSGGVMGRILVTQKSESDLFVGGLVAKNNLGGVIVNCFGETSIAINVVSGAQNVVVGGFVAKNEGIIKAQKVGINWNTYSFTSTISMSGSTVNSFVGGLVGINYNIIDSSMAVVSNTEKHLSNINVFTEIDAEYCNNIGGIAGENQAVIQGVLVSAKINGHDNVGGAVGYNSSVKMSTIAGYSYGLYFVFSEFYNNRENDKTSIYGNSNVGGLVGFDDTGYINACYATTYVTNTAVAIEPAGFYGDICAKDNVGGLVGMGTDTTIVQSFANTGIGLDVDQNGVCGGLIGYYVVTSMDGGHIVKSYAINNFGTLVSDDHNGLKENRIGQLVGVLKMSTLINEVIDFCYAITNGGVLSYSESEGIMGYRALVNVEKGTDGSITTSSVVNNNGDAEVCAYCYYADADAVSPINGACVSVKTVAEMQTFSTYSGYSTNDWKVNETANGGFPLIMVKLNGTGTAFELYNAQVGSISINQYKSDESFAVNGTIMPKFVEYGDGKMIVVLEMLCHKTVVDGKEVVVWDNLTLEDLLELSATDMSMIDVKIQNNDGTLIVRVNDRKLGADRFELDFQKAGVVKLSIQAKQNSAVSKTFQICAVGGFKDVTLSSDRLYIAKEGSNTAIVNFEQDAKSSYNEKQQIQLKVVSSWASEASEYAHDPYSPTNESTTKTNVTVGESSFDESNTISSIDVTTNKTLLFTGINEPGRVCEIEVVPYITIGFYNEHGNLETTDLLLRYGTTPLIASLTNPQTIATKLDFSTLRTVVFEGVNSIKLNEEEATLQNSGKLDVDVFINSDAISQIEPTIQSELKIEVVKSVFDKETESFVDATEYKAEISWNTNPQKMFLYEKIGETSSGEPIYSNTHTEDVYVISSVIQGKDMIISFSCEHEKVRMAQKEKETWTFSYKNQDGKSKSATLNIIWEPSIIESIGALHYINATEYSDGKFEIVGADEATNRIASGSRGVLKIQVTQAYSDYDYIIVKGSSDSITMNFTRLLECETKDGNKLDVDNEIYSQNLLDGGIKLENLFGKYANESGWFIDSSNRKLCNTQNGVFYVSTLIPSGLSENTRFTIDIYAYKTTENGDELVYSTEALGETKVLYSAFAPYIYLNVHDDYSVARTSDGGLLARGTELKIHMTGVLQQSTVSVSLSGYESSDDLLAGCMVVWDNPIGGVTTALTQPSFEGDLFVYAGINSLANNKEGKLILSVTVNSPGFATTTQISLYLVDYLVFDLGVENVADGVYNIKIQDGAKPLKLKFNTSFGEFLLTSDSSTNLTEAKQMANKYVGLIGDAINVQFTKSYTKLSEQIIAKLKELNALGTSATGISSTIWRYRNANLNISSNTYEYFYLNVDNKYKNNNVVTIKGKEEVIIDLSVALHRGVKLSQNGNMYELIMQISSITETFLGVSSGDYNYAFKVRFTNESSSDLPIPRSTEQELKEMVAGGHYILTKDITVTNWVPLTTKIGSLDGNGYKIIIKNFNIATTSNGAPRTSLNAGLFESISTYYDTKTESTQPTRLTNIILDISQTVIVDLGNATGVNFGFLVGHNDGGVIYNCEVISGVSENMAKLNIDSDVDVSLVAGSTTVYYYNAGDGVWETTEIANFSRYLELYKLKFDPHNTTPNVDDDKKVTYAYEIVNRQGDNLVLDNGEVIDIFAEGVELEGYVKGIIYSNRFGSEVKIDDNYPTQQEVLNHYVNGGYYVYQTKLVESKVEYNNFVANFYNYVRNIQIVGYQNEKFVLANGDIIDILSDAAEADGYEKSTIYSDADGSETPTIIYASSLTEDELRTYANGNYYVRKTDLIEITNNNLSMFNYEAWQKLFETEKEKLTSIYGAYAQNALKKIEKMQDTTSVFILSLATIQSSSTVNIGGLVGNNSGYISNSRVGRVKSVETVWSNGRQGIDENGDGIVDSLMQEYGVSIFGCGRLGGLASLNSGVIAGSYFANSNLVNMHEITDNQYIITGGLVAFNNGKINTSYVESNKQEIKFDLYDGDDDSTSGSFSINGEDYKYFASTAGKEIRRNGVAILSFSGVTFVLNGVEYEIDVHNKTGSLVQKECVINHVRRTQNNIYFSGEIGGLVHSNAGEIENCYTNIGLKSTLSVGGLVYDNMSEYSSIKYCYSTCAMDNENVTNGPFVGASKAGDICNSGTIENSYYLIDYAIKQNSQEEAAAVDRLNLCKSHDLLVGLVFASKNQSGMWQMDESAEFETPRLIDTDMIAFSRREYVVENGLHSYNNNSFGQKENPKIVYSKESLTAVGIDENYNILGNVRVVANIDFNQESPTMQYNETSSRLLSVCSLLGTSFQGNGMTFNNLNIVADDTTNSNYVGLFKMITGKASVANLNMVVRSFDGTMTNYVGAVAGLVHESVVHNIKVSSISSSIYIKGRHIVGGAIGEIYGTTAKASNIECSISVNSTFDAANETDYEFINIDHSVQQTGISNVQATSYAGGVVGAVVVGSDVNRYNSPSVVNCSVRNDFIIQGEIVGGVVGFVSTNAAISGCTLILNTSEKGQELQSGKIAGGLVGENRGLISLSYVSLKKDVQRASDLKLSEDGRYDEQAGTSSLFTGSDNVLGGLVGLNVGSTATQENKYSGIISSSYSRVKVENEQASIAGGLVGVAIAKINEYDNVAEITEAIQPTKMYTYKKILDGGTIASFVEETSSGSIIKQSLFLSGVYTTGTVKAKNAAGGLVGVATALVSTINDDTSYPLIISLPDSTIATSTVYSGVLIGNANYIAQKYVAGSLEPKYVYFSNKCAESQQGVSTIHIDSSTNLIGGMDNSQLYKGNYYSFTNDENVEIKYYNMFDVISSVYNMKIVFSYMWYSTSSDYTVDTTRNKYIFPELASGIKTSTSEITTVERYLQVVKGGEIGNYKITSNLEFDFDEEKTYDVNGNNDAHTLYYWFEKLYMPIGPSGEITGAQSTGRNITITIKNNTRGVSFFGGSVSGLTVSNIDFEYVNTSSNIINCSSSDATSMVITDLYWGALTSKASSSTFMNISVDFGDVVIKPNNYLGVGGLVGQSIDNRYNEITIANLNINKTGSDSIDKYQLRRYNEKYYAYFGGVAAKSSGDIFDRILNIETADIKIQTSNEESGAVYVGGIAGYSDGSYFRINQSKELYFDLRKQSLAIESNVETTYVGGVVGYVLTDNANYINNVVVSGITIRVIANDAYVGGVCGRIKNTSIQNVEVANILNNDGSVQLASSITVVANNLYVGGLVGYGSCDVEGQNESLQTKGTISQSKANVNINVNAQGGNSYYVGGIAGYTLLDDASINYADVKAVEVDLFTQNQTGGNITVVGQSQETAYVAGMFAKVDTMKITTTKIGMSKMANNAIVYVEKIKRAYIGGICADCDVLLSTVANYASLTNNFSPISANLASSLSYIGGIVAITSQTEQSINACLSLGAIFEPNFVDYYDDVKNANVQNSFAQAIVCCDEEDNIFGPACYYSSDFTGIVQTNGNISQSMNLGADSILSIDLEIPGFEKTANEGSSYRLVHIKELRTPIYVYKISSLDAFTSNSNNKVFVMNKDGLENATLQVTSTITTLPAGGNFSIIGNDCCVCTNGCALFESIPSRVLVSGLNVYSSSSITISTDTNLKDSVTNKALADENNSFGILAKTNNGIITNCMVGSLPKKDQVSSENKVFTTLSNGLALKIPGVSESGITTINITGSANAVVGALVGVNNKVITNSLSYVDTNLSSGNACYVSNLVGLNNFKVSLSSALGKLNVTAAVFENSSIGEVIGKTKGVSTLYNNQLFGYVDVLYSGSGKAIGGVVGGSGSSNDQMFYVEEMSRSPSCFINAVGLKKFYSNQIFGDKLDGTSNVKSEFWTRDNEHLYGYYCLNINRHKLLTSHEGVFEIENYIEFNMLNYERSEVEYVFVRDLSITTKLSADYDSEANATNKLSENNKLTIDGNGHYLFAETLVNAGWRGGHVYSAFNMQLRTESVMKNIVFNFKQTTIEPTTSLDAVEIAPLVREIAGGTVENCAVVGTVVINAKTVGESEYYKFKGSFGGICSKIYSGGTLTNSWSGVNLTIKKAKEFVIGGLSAEASGMSGLTTQIEKCFVDSTINIQELTDTNFVGGFVGKIDGGTYSSQGLSETVLKDIVQIKSCYVSRLAEIRTTQFNSAESTMNMGEFGGSVNLSGAAQSTLIQDSIFEGTFIGATGSQNLLLGDTGNYDGDYKPLVINYDSYGITKMVYSNLGFGKLINFSGISVASGADSLFTTAIATYNGEKIGEDTNQADKQYVTYTYNNYAGQSSVNDRLSSEVFVYVISGLGGTNSCPYLKDVTPSDRQYPIS